MMKLMVLSISIHLCNTSGFVTSGSTFSSYFRKLNWRNELNLSQILFEFDETLQLYWARLNKQKSQRWHRSIFYSFRDKNPRKLRRLTFTKNTNMFVVYSFFLHCTCWVCKISASYLHYFFFGEFLKFLMEIIWRFRI